MCIKTSKHFTMTNLYVSCLISLVVFKMKNTTEDQKVCFIYNTESICCISDTYNKGLAVFILVWCFLQNVSIVVMEQIDMTQFRGVRAYMKQRLFYSILCSQSHCFNALKQNI